MRSIGEERGFAKLARDASHAHHGEARSVGENHRHLQDHREPIADRLEGNFRERFGAVSSLQHDRPSFTNVAKRCKKTTGFRGIDERGEAFELRERILEFDLVGPVRGLFDRQVTP